MTSGSELGFRLRKCCGNHYSRLLNCKFLSCIWRASAVNPPQVHRTSRPSCSTVFTVSMGTCCSSPDSRRFGEVGDSSNCQCRVYLRVSCDRPPSPFQSPFHRMLYGSGFPQHPVDTHLGSSRESSLPCPRLHPVAVGGIVAPLNLFLAFLSCCLLLPISGPCLRRVQHPRVNHGGSLIFMLR